MIVALNACAFNADCNSSSLEALVGYNAENSHQLPP